MNADEPVNENAEGDADGQERRIKSHDGTSLVEEEDVLLYIGELSKQKSSPTSPGSTFSLPWPFSTNRNGDRGLLQHRSQ